MASAPVEFNDNRIYLFSTQPHGYLLVSTAIDTAITTAKPASHPSANTTRNFHMSTADPSAHSFQLFTRAKQGGVIDLFPRISYPQIWKERDNAERQEEV